MLYEIPLKTFTAEFPLTDKSAVAADGPPKTWNFTSAEMLEIVLTTPRQAGFNMQEVQKTLSVLDELKKAEKSCAAFVRLDGVHFTFVKTAIEAHVWGAPKREFLEFANDVIGATKIEANEPPAPAAAVKPASKTK